MPGKPKRASSSNTPATTSLHTKTGTEGNSSAHSLQPSVSYSLCPYMGTSRGPAGNMMLLVDMKGKAIPELSAEFFCSEKQTESWSLNSLQHSHGRKYRLEVSTADSLHPPFSRVMLVILILLNIVNRITNLTLFTQWKKLKEKIPYMTMP